MKIESMSPRRQDLLAHLGVHDVLRYDPLSRAGSAEVDRLHLPDGTTVIFKTAATQPIPEANVLRDLYTCGVPVPRVRHAEVVDGVFGMLLQDLGTPSRPAALTDVAYAAVQVHNTALNVPRPALDQAALAETPARMLALVERIAARGTALDSSLRGLLIAFCLVAGCRAEGAHLPPFGLMHGGLRHGTVHIGREGVWHVLDFAHARTGPGLLDLAAWPGLDANLDPPAVRKLIELYIQAGGHPDATATRGCLPAEVWALGWLHMRAAHQLLQEADSDAGGPASETDGTEKDRFAALRRHLDHAWELLRHTSPSTAGPKPGSEFPMPDTTSDTLSDQMRTVVRVIRSLPAGAPAFGPALIEAVLVTGESTAAAVLAALHDRDLVVPAPQDRVTLADAATDTGDAQPGDPDAIDAAALYFIHNALAADQDRDPFAREKMSPDYAVVTSRHATPVEAMRWYEPHHDWYMLLLRHLADRGRHELTMTIAEAVCGLAGDLGRHRDKVIAAQHALRALDSMHDDLADEQSAGREYHMWAARIRLTLAATLINQRDYNTAHHAIEKAHRNGIAADSNRVLASVHRCRGRLLHAEGDLTEASRQLDTAYLMDSSADKPHLMALSLRRHGEVLTDLGNHDRAATLLHEAAMHTTRLDHPIATARVMTSTAALHIAAGEPGKALDVLLQARDTMIKHGTGCARHLADIHRLLALAQRTTDPEAAAKSLDAAVRYYQAAHDEDAAQHLETEWTQMQSAT